MRIQVANKVVVRYKDGRVSKGTTRDFVPGKAVFHLQVLDRDQIVELTVEDLKAVFFVKDFGGDSGYSEVRRFPHSPEGAKGKKIAIVFKDGEMLAGYTLGYDSTRPGFFIVPADEKSNNERVYVIRSAVAQVGIGLKADEVLSEHASS